MALEEAFDIEIPDEAAEGITTVGDAVSGLIGDFDIKGLFQGHHQFNSVEGVSTQIVLEVGFRLDLAGINAELLRHDRTDFFEDRFLGHGREDGTTHPTGLRLSPSQLVIDCR